MAVIEFKNLPDTSTPVNANNLNSMQQDIYSTSEIKTNKVWTDNKPIYRKVISTNTPSTADTTSRIGYLGIPIDTLVKLESYIQMTSTVWVPNPQYLAGTIYNYIYLQSCDTISEIIMSVKANNYTSVPINIVVEYTKP